METENLHSVLALLGWVVIIIAWRSVETGLRSKPVSFVMQKAAAEWSYAVSEEKEGILAQAL